ncbi:MAG TPA: polysaccharide pyruvyl transferase family protein [Sedimentisphaerales bacterium]|nr:polysaccharide pyruvyl transferase family protein [Sedimentisphaerales bacterium]HNU31201.1 polysaccharide pyruvyl transferase family protein [Sedimentisphaerales bacterium]
MDSTLHILIADYVPLANKGEEAIVRGIEDMLSEGRPVSLGLFDNVPEVTQRGNVTIFPREWLFRFEGNSALSPRGRILMQMWISARLRMGSYGPLKNLTSRGAPQCRPLRDFFERAQYVLVGHDGVFCVESCGIIHLAKQHGKRAGILGASTGLAGGRFYKAWLYRRTLEEADFCIFREEHSCESIRQISRDPAQLRVAPDPAFAMRPDPPESARDVLERDDSFRKAKQTGRPIVAVTALEKGRVYAGFRPDLQGLAKQQAHAAYLAAVLDPLVARHRAFVLFLPHSVEQAGSDIVAARHVAEQMKAAPSDYAILEHDCGARLLKSIVRECDFLVGERTHSLIGAMSVGTPFVAMTNRQDTRTHGILGQMCRCESQIIDVDAVGERDASQRVCGLFEKRDAICMSLEPVRQGLSSQIDAIVRVIKGHPEQ